MRFIVGLLSITVLGCGGNILTTEYEFVQKEDGIAMKAPIRWRIRPQWSRDTLSVNRLATDALGRTNISMPQYYTYWSVTGIGMKCERFDDHNWSCSLGTERRTDESWTMTDGDLRWHHFGEDRKLTTRHRLGGIALPF